MAFLPEILAKIDSDGHGTSGTDLFQGFMPDTPDACTCIYETQGVAPQYHFSNNVGWENPRLQVVSRNIDYATARSLAESIYKDLDDIAGTSLSGTNYIRIAALQSPFFSHRDGNDRIYIVCNFEVMKEIS